MNTTSRPTNPQSRRQTAHPSITDQQVSDLVDQFYSRVQTNARLSGIFAEHMHNEWDRHLPKMKAFWRSVLLKTGEYKGKPVPVHTALTGVVSDDFRVWLELFSQTATEVFSPEAQPVVNEAAIRIATSLWLAMTADPFAPLPDWTVIAADQAANAARLNKGQRP